MIALQYNALDSIVLLTHLICLPASGALRLLEMQDALSQKSKFVQLSIIEETERFMKYELTTNPNFEDLENGIITVEAAAQYLGRFYAVDAYTTEPDISEMFYQDLIFVPQ